jgi:large subunit ribosomal protein L10
MFGRGGEIEFMPTEKKNEAIEALKQRIAASPTVFFTDFRGLTVGELRTLRNALRKESVAYSVIKNTLFGIAIGSERRAELKTILEGPTGVAFAGTDPVGAAKALAQFASDSKKLKIKAAIVDGRLIDRAQVEALSKVPPRQELLARLVGSARSPLVRLHGAMSGHHRKLVYVLKAIHDKRLQAEPAA